MPRREKIPAVMVVGAGVGGMRAAIDLADSEFKVYLIDALSSIGGIVAQLGFMFPTHDCVLCRGTAEHGYGCCRPAISPFLLDHNRHSNIELLTWTTAEKISGRPGDFTVTLQRRARHVQIEKCINCGRCAEVCPVERPSLYQAGLVKRKAAFKASPRAIPDAYAIEKGDYCESCRRCQAACPTNAIDLDEPDRSEEIRVGAIILAVGYELYRPSESPEYGYGRYPNVVTGIQYERLASRSGPTEGIPARPSDGRAPQKIAWLQCIGSRDQKHPYCSSICCMYATKEAILAKQRIPGVECRIFIMDERAFSKEYNAYFEQSKAQWGVGYTRCRISAVKEDPKTHDLILQYRDEAGSLKEERFELVVLSVGSEPPRNAIALAETLGIKLNEYGFCLTDKFDPLDTSRSGIFVAGAFSTPKEIPETIIDASGAAARAMRLLSGSAHRPQAGLPAERKIWGEPPRLGVFLCRCGGEISQTVDLTSLRDYGEELPGVAHVEILDYACLAEGLPLIKNAIERQRLNRVVVAACTPRTHEALFQRLLRESGLNPYLLEFVSLREHCAWVHGDDPAAATRKAQEMVRIGIARARTLRPVQKLRRPVLPSALVLGGGLAGMTAALTLADEGFPIYLIEKEPTLGGNLRNLHRTAEGANPQELLRSLVKQVECHERITIFTNTELSGFSGQVGHFRSRLHLSRPDGSLREEEIEHGVAIVATGAREYQGDVYLLGHHPHVRTQLQLEKLLVEDVDLARQLRQVVMIQCVRPNGQAVDYCSRVCCTNTMKNAIRIKQLNPDCQIYVLYKDLITYGFREQFYTEARRRGVLFVRYHKDKPQVSEQDGQLTVRVTDPILGDRLELRPDLVVLSTAIVPQETNASLAQLLGLPLSREGFFMEAHLKLRPMDFIPDGIFLCGMAHYPKFIEETIAHALAAAGRAMTVLSKEELEVGGVVAEVDPSKCVACLTCVRTCPFGVPRIDRNAIGNGGLRGAATIDPAQCQGCGICTSECPANAIQLRHYHDDQIMVRDEPILGRWLATPQPVTP